MHYLGQATNARFMLYSGDFYSLQNKTGLFQYFFIFVGALTTFVWLYYKPSSELWSRLKKIGLTSGCLAVVMLTVFHFNVVVSSRLADLLLLPLLLVLGANLFQLKERRQWFLLWGMTLSLIGYGILRGIVSFKPTLFQEFLKYINSFI
jgi:drug/metabolite transporter (DMT)-like permease